MLDATERTNRTSPLAHLAGGASSGSFRLEVEPALSRWSLRIAPGDAAEIGDLAGFDISGPINSQRRNGDGTRRACRLGPDEWLLSAPHGDYAQVESVFQSSLANRSHAIADISHRNVGLVVSGTAAIDVLASGCALDLDPAAFPTGTATRTMFAKAEIVLARLSDAPAFEIQVWRSFARYTAERLIEAGEMQAALDAWHG